MPSLPRCPGACPRSAPSPLPQGAVELQLIGRVRLVGDVPAGASELSEPSLEALAALALQEGQPLTREELRALLGAGRETERSAGTVSNYLANLATGSSAPSGCRRVGCGGLPRRRYRHRLFARFHELVRLAKAEPDSAAHHLADALSLVRECRSRASPSTLTVGPTATTSEP